MKIYVMPVDIHPVAGHPGDFRDFGKQLVGETLTITQDRVTLDGIAVLKRDRLFRMEGHPWVAQGHLMWTGFTVRVKED